MYEIVIHTKGTKTEIVSPTTYSTAEDAARDLEPIHAAIAADSPVRLSWYGGRAENINAAVIRETSESRPASTESLEDLVKRLEEVGVIRRTQAE